MTPDTIGVKDALPLSLLVVERDPVLRIIPVRFEVIGAAQRIGLRAALPVAGR